MSRARSQIVDSDYKATSAKTELGNNFVGCISTLPKRPLFGTKYKGFSRFINGNVF
jgi:hypothetical protein